MLASQHRPNVLSSLFLYSSFLGFAALWFSPFIVSVVTAICALLVIYQWKSVFNYPNRSIPLILISIVTIGLVNLIFEPKSGDRLLLSIGFLVITLAGFQRFNVDKSRLSIYLILIAAVVCVINGIAVGNYLSDKEYYDELLLQSKSIPIIGGFHHIHFGIISAIVLLGLSGLIVLDLVSKKLKIFSAIMLIIILVCFHVLSSRTGIVSFYIAALVSFAVYSVRKGRYMLLILGPILMVLMLGITYAASTSFQNKVASTLEDIDSWGKGTEINHKSMAMRIEAYKVAVHLIKNKPFGTGAYGQKQAIMKVYEDNNSVLTIENRKEPHNQFLEFGVKYGWFGIFVMVLLFISLLSLTQNVCYPFIGLVAVLFVSMQFESLLERQVSVYFMSLFIPLYYYLFQRNTINGSALT